MADAAHEAGILLRRVDADTVGIACSELTTTAHTWRRSGRRSGSTGDAAPTLDAATEDALPAALLRESEYLTHPVFHTTARRPRCCAGCAGWPTPTWPWTAR